MQKRLRLKKKPKRRNFEGSPFGKLREPSFSSTLPPQQFSTFQPRTKSLLSELAQTYTEFRSFSNGKGVSRFQSGMVGECSRVFRLLRQGNPETLLKFTNETEIQRWGPFLNSQMLKAVKRSLQYKLQKLHDDIPKEQIQLPRRLELVVKPSRPTVQFVDRVRNFQSEYGRLNISDVHFWKAEQLRKASAQLFKLKHKIFKC